MIDPRALQQHFRKVQQNERPPKPEIPQVQVPNIKSLTAIQAIPVPVEEKQVKEISEVVLKQEEVIIPAQIEPEVIKEPEPIELVVSTEHSPDTEVAEEIIKEEVYDPYGYYSGPQY